MNQFEPNSCRRRRKRRNIRYENSAASEGVHVRQNKRAYPNGSYDPYYSNRYASTVSVDPRLLDLVNALGRDNFVNKQVLDIGCGVGLISFHIAALCGASHVVALDLDLELILLNLKQLRKFKHDGILRAQPEGEDYPSLLVRRNGPVRCTNKPWNIPRHFSPDTFESKFPFNIEFRCGDVLTSYLEVDTFDVVVCLKVVKLVKIESLRDRITRILKPGGLLVTDSNELGNDPTHFIRLGNSQFKHESIFLFRRSTSACS